MTRLRVAAGFTLVELLLAMAITAIVTASVFGLVTPARHISPLTEAATPAAASALCRSVVYGPDDAGLARARRRSDADAHRSFYVSRWRRRIDAAAGRYFPTGPISMVQGGHRLAPRRCSRYLLTESGYLAQLMHYDGGSPSFR